VRIEWTETAEASVLAIADYISIDDPGAALAAHDEIHQQVARLADHPHMGRQGRCAGTRELVINRTPYIVAYRVERAAIVILRVLHAAQRWPTTLWGGAVDVAHAPQHSSERSVRRTPALIPALPIPIFSEPGNRLWR
jgi:toxin ParE1/3/4